MVIKKDTAVTVLDYIDNITVPGNVFHEPANEYWALICFQHGMEFLYHQAHRCDLPPFSVPVVMRVRVG
jgi:hypothetical protein